MTAPLLASWLLLASPATAVASASPAAPGHVRFAASFEAARSEAQKRALPIAVSFHTSWCGWCRRMERETWRDSRVVAKGERDVVFVALDAEDGATGSELARKHKVRSYPTVVLLDPRGNEIDRMRGYRAPDAFLSELETILGRRAETEALLDRERRSPDDPQTLFEVAAALERARREEEAARRYDRILGLKDERARRFRDLALWNLAGLAVKLNDAARALDAFLRLAQEFPESPNADEALVQAASLQNLLGSVDEAIATCERMLGRYPQSPYAPLVRDRLAELKASARRQ